MSTPIPREHLADILARSYGDRPLAELSAAAATPHYRAADACLAALPLGGEASSTALLGARSRIEETLHEIAAFETDDVDVIGLLLHLVAILDGPVRPVDPAEPPCPLTADLIRQRVSDSLTANWPRMAYADHVADITDSVMNVVLPITTQLKDGVSGWQSKAAHALASRDRTRATAVTLEQITAEAARLLRVGLAGQALAVLESDGRPLGPCGAPSFLGDTPCARPAGHGGVHSDDAGYVDPPHECPEPPERLFVVLSAHGTRPKWHDELDLDGVFSDVEGANARARDLASELFGGRPATETTDPDDGTVTLAREPREGFAGLIRVVALPLDPHIADARAEAERDAAGIEYDADYGRDLDEE
ncbi:hypothetical protein [Streptomyces sp. CC210A]|uniref:hypothetical protein n=1 Tax=Streptomyces sp. CC210A TaxID=2898184 RepID=UPI001F223E88|nr:hypothetical protein [Streptomyces sp. CC210A]